MPTWEYWNAHQLLVYQKSNQFFTLQFSEPCESSWVLARKAWWKKRSHYSILNHLILKVEEEKVWNPMQSKPHYFRNDPLVVSEPAQCFRACPGFQSQGGKLFQSLPRVVLEPAQGGECSSEVSTSAASKPRHSRLHLWIKLLAPTV